MRQPKARHRFRFAAAILLLTALGVWPAARAQSAPMGKQAREYYDTGRYRQAIQVLRTEIAESPRDAAPEFWLGRCYYELRDFGRAVDSMERAVKLEPGNSDFHDWLGRAYGRKAEHSNPFSAFSLARKTHREFDAAVRLDKTNLAAQRDLILFFLNAPGIVGGGDDRALQQIATLALVNPTEADLARAQYFQKRKQYDLADKQYQRILNADSSRIGVYLEIAGYYGERGDAENMRKAVDAAASVAPNDRRLEYYRGAALVLAKENPQEAERHLRTYLDTVPDNTEVPSHASAHEWLGRLYENQQRMQDAVREYKAALTLSPDNKQFREALKRAQKQSAK